MEEEQFGAQIGVEIDGSAFAKLKLLARPANQDQTAPFSVDFPTYERSVTVVKLPEGGEGFSLVRQYAGHGIGRSLHEEPDVPNYVDRRGPNPLLRPGMVICIEPMVNVSAPAMSKLPPRRRRTSLTNLHATSAAAIPIGGLIKSTQRQVSS